jgi:hypothetical protein
LSVIVYDAIKLCSVSANLSLYLGICDERPR